MNAVQSTFEKFLSRSLQVNMKPRQIWTQIAGSVDDAQILKRGQQFSKSTKSRVPVQPYVRGTDLVGTTLTTAEEVLTINEQPSFMFEIDDLDEFQSNVDIQDEYTSDSEIDLSNYIDAVFLYEHAMTAANVTDNGDLGGTAGDSIPLTSGNVFSVLSISKRKLARRASDMTNLCMAATPEFCEVIEEQVSSRETTFGDEATRNGIKYAGGRTFMYNGIMVYETLNLPSTEFLGLATNPTDGDTLVFSVHNVFEDVAEVLTVTFVNAIGTTPGNVLIGADVAATRVNLAAFLNNPTVTSATQVAYTGTASWVATRIVATDIVADDEVQITLKGGRFESVTETLTAGTDGFIATKRADEVVLAQRNSCDIVIQKYPHTEVEGIQKQFGTRVKGYTMLGVRQFASNAKNAVRIPVRFS